MKIVYQVTVTDEDVKQNVIDTVEEFENDDEIEFPSDEVREQFIDDCTESICDKYEAGYWNHELLYMDYENEVGDMVLHYGIGKGQ